MNEANELVRWIHNNLSERSILEQLAEEAAELAAVHVEMARTANYVAKYALKVIRATNTENPTITNESLAKVALRDALSEYDYLKYDLQEEYLDMGNAASAYYGKCNDFDCNVEKLRRWKERVENAKIGD